jgi:hypothetical protein
MPVWAARIQKKRVTGSCPTNLSEWLTEHAAGNLGATVLADRAPGKENPCIASVSVQNWREAGVLPGARDGSRSRCG